MLRGKNNQAHCCGQQWRMPPRRAVVALSLALFCCAIVSVSRTAAASTTAEPAGVEFFERRIRPIFVENCYKCHSAEAEKIKGSFLLDTREGLLKGGETGPAIVPGEPEKSLLIKAVRYTDENLQMPPKNKKLAPDQIADLEAWIKMGAPDPRSPTQPATRNTPPASRHWAFQSIKEPPVPLTKNRRWIKTPVDA